MKLRFVKFADMKLKNKLIVSYFLLILLILGTISFALFYASSRTMREQGAFQLEQNFNRTHAFLTYKLNQIIRTSDTIVANATLNAILNKSPANYSAIEQVKDMQTIRKLLKSFQDEDAIYRANLYVSDDLMYASENVNIHSLGEARNSSWGRKLLANRSKLLTLTFDDIAAGQQDGKEVVAIARYTKQANDYNQIGYFLRLDIEKQNIVDILKDADFTGDSVTYLVNRDNRVVAASSDANLAAFGVGDRTKLPAADDGELDETRLGGGKVMLMTRTIPDTDWTMVGIVPHSSFMMAINQLGRLIVIISVAIAIVAFVLARLIAIPVTRRIMALSRHMQQAQDGKLNVIKEDGSSRDEVGKLYRSYNYMIANTNALLKEKIKLGQELKGAELKALYSQINPHFLYNTLDMINWLSYRNKSDQVAVVVNSLASFYKLSLNKGREIVTIQDELKHVSSYLNIQDIRFSGKIAFEIEVQPVLLQYAIPNITLQPIVENAIVHGILEKESKTGKLTIKGDLQAGEIVLTVEDDGVGMSPETSAGIMGQEPQESRTGSHYGLRNIDRRIKLVYGEKYKLTFSSRPGEGTKVEIRLPPLYPKDIEFE